MADVRIAAAQALAQHNPAAAPNQLVRYLTGDDDRRVPSRGGRGDGAAGARSQEVEAACSAISGCPGRSASVSSSRIWRSNMAATHVCWPCCAGPCSTLTQPCAKAPSTVSACSARWMRSCRRCATSRPRCARQPPRRSGASACWRQRRSRRSKRRWRMPMTVCSARPARRCAGWGCSQRHDLAPRPPAKESPNAGKPPLRRDTIGRRCWSSGAASG